MENPNTTTRNSLAIRVLRIDVSNVQGPVVDREWAALLDVKPAKKSPLSDKVSALWPAGPDKLLIEERDDTISSDPAASTKIYKVDFSRATNLLGGAYDQPATSPTLEQQYIPTTDGVVPPNPAGVTPGQKSLCIDVDAALGRPRDARRGQRQRLRSRPHYEPGGQPGLEPHEHRFRAAAGGLFVGRASRAAGLRRPAVGRVRRPAAD